MPKNANKSNIKANNDLMDEKEELLNSMRDILSFCPFCGVKIEWSEDLKYCIKCGGYIIPYIPRNKASIWLGKKYFLSQDELDDLYSPKLRMKHKNQIIDFTYVKKRKLDWKAALIAPLLAFFIQIVAIFAFLFIIILLDMDNLLLDPNDFINKPEFMIFGFIATFIFLIIPYLYIRRYLPMGASKNDRLKAIGIPMDIQSKSLLKEITIGIVFALIMTIVVVIAQFLSAFLTNLIYNQPIEVIFETEIGSDSTSLGLLIIIIVFMFISVGPSEEILFRGFSQKGFEKSLGKGSGLIITALYFTLFHIFAYIFEPWFFFYSFLPYFSISLLLGVLYMWRRNVYASIFSHALYNSIQFIMAHFFPNFVMIIIWTVGIILIIYLITFLTLKIRTKKKGEIRIE